MRQPRKFDLGSWVRLDGILLRGAAWFQNLGIEDALFGESRGA